MNPIHCRLLPFLTACPATIKLQMHFSSLLSQASPVSEPIPQKAIQMAMMTNTEYTSQTWRALFEAILPRDSQNLPTQVYASAQNRFLSFWGQHQFQHLHVPLSESTLCRFAALLEDQNASIRTIKVYPSWIHHLQISAGLPDPFRTSP